MGKGVRTEKIVVGLNEETDTKRKDKKRDR